MAIRTLKLPLLQVDAFADRLFEGNPAAVCLLPPDSGWPGDGVLQCIAAENNLAETAFLLKQSDEWQIRWFTPTLEVDLCGHATLASAHALTELAEDPGPWTFSSRSGPLLVTASEGTYTLDFPRLDYHEANPDLVVGSALGCPVEGVWQGMDLLAVVSTWEVVQDLHPDFRAISQFPSRGLIVTAAGGPSPEIDFSSRFFAPQSGIDEDPVTGSAHCLLAPFWGRKLGKTSLIGRQLSARGGTVVCEVCGDRVRLSGGAVTYLRGEASVPDWRD